MLFILTEKLALQKEMPYIASNMLYQVSFRTACLRTACPETPNAMTGKEEKSLTDGELKHHVLKNEEKVNYSQQVSPLFLPGEKSVLHWGWEARGPDLETQSWQN